MTLKQFLVGCLTALTFSFPAWADGTAVMVSEDGKVKVEFTSSGMLRMDDASGEGYMLMRDGKLYSVIEDGGSVMVFDIAAAIASVGSLGQQGGFWDAEMVELVAMKATGGSEEVDGLKGHIYEMTYRNRAGHQHTDTIVLTKDKTAALLTQASLTMASILIAATGESISPAFDKMADFTRDGGWGVLRQGESYRLTQVQDVAVDASRFVLPAEPMQIPSMESFMGAQAEEPVVEETEEEKQQRLAAYLESKAQRQEQRAKGKADRAVDRATDKAVDKVVDSVLGKLF